MLQFGTYPLQDKNVVDSLDEVLSDIELWLRPVLENWDISSMFSVLRFNSSFAGPGHPVKIGAAGGGPGDESPHHGVVGPGDENLMSVDHGLSKQNPSLLKVTRRRCLFR